MKGYYVYIATNYKNTVLYTGVTNNINRRMFEHANQINKDSFTAKYNVNKLVYVEFSQYVYDALNREKQIKGWLRAKKIALIESLNPEWKNLLDDDCWVE